MHVILQPFVDRAGVVILDGALATELERRGADLRDPIWSAKLLLEDPDLIRQVHLDYFNAGADVATTASYQASLPALMRRGLTEAHAAEVLRPTAAGVPQRASTRAGHRALLRYCGLSPSSRSLRNPRACRRSAGLH